MADFRKTGSGADAGPTSSFTSVVKMATVTVDPASDTVHYCGSMCIENVSSVRADAQLRDVGGVSVLNEGSTILAGLRIPMGGFFCDYIGAEIAEYIGGA